MYYEDFLTYIYHKNTLIIFVNIKIA